jgi:hypothetical protein
MDDIELAQLEQRLQRSVVGHRPDAPDSLMRFIDAVPAGERAGRTAELVRPGPALGQRARRSFFALATAAALIVAVVAGLGLVALRNGQFGAGPQGFSNGGWSWQRADGTVLGVTFRVTNGYLGVCGAEPDQTLCSSPDGLNWTTPAEPAIVDVEAGGQFLPRWIAQRGGVYVAFGMLTYVASTATPTPIVAPSDGSTASAAPSTTPIWRSTDGVHWSQVDSPAFSGLTVSSVAGLANGFVALTVSDPGESGLAFTSTDGLNWTRAGQLPVQPQRTASGEAGLYIGSTAGSGETWRTTDGENWERVQMPVGVTLGVAYALSSGGFVANGLSASTNGYEILRSADGLTWTVDHGDLVGVPLGLVVIGDRLVANVSPMQLNSSAYPDASTFTSKAFEVWQSIDGGRTWQPLLDASGQQMSGMVESLGNRLAVFTPQYDPVAWKIAWVGTPTS